jgi:hypothetical protein
MTENERVLRPVDRYEWTHVLKRARLQGVIAGSGNVGKGGKQTRGAVSGATFKAVAYTWASYSDEHGGNIRPGDATVAVEAEVGIEVVRVVKLELIALGLIERVRAGTRATGWCDVYRLTIPDDLRDQVEVFSEAQHEMAAEAIREKKRRKPRTGSGGGSTQDVVRGPAEVVRDAAVDHVRGPAEVVQPAVDGPCTTSADAQNEGCTGSGGGRVRGPAEACTNHDQPPTTTNHSGAGLRTAVTVSRARAPLDKPDLAEVEEPNPPPAAAGLEECEHGVPPWLRCPACARGLVTIGARSRPSEGHDPPDRDDLATVLTFRPRSASA